MAKKKGIIAGVSALASGIGAGIGGDMSPISYRPIADTSWHINNNDGTMGYLSKGVQTLNESGHGTAMAIGAGVGLLAGGYAAYRALKNRNLGRQWDEEGEK